MATALQNIIVISKFSRSHASVCYVLVNPYVKTPHNVFFTTPHTIFNTLHTIFNKLCTIFNKLCTIFNTLHTIITTLHTIFKTLHTIITTLHTILNTLHTILKTLHTIFNTLHTIFNTLHTILTTLHTISKTLQHTNFIPDVLYFKNFTIFTAQTYMWSHYANKCRALHKMWGLPWLFQEPLMFQEGLRSLEFGS